MCSTAPALYVCSPLVRCRFMCECMHIRLGSLIHYVYPLYLRCFYLSTFHARSENGHASAGFSTGEFDGNMACQHIYPVSPSLPDAIDKLPGGELTAQSPGRDSIAILAPYEPPGAVHGG